MPVVEDGQVVPPKTVSMTVSMDHYLVDAHEGLLAVNGGRTRGQFGGLIEGHFRLGSLST
jgi:hypothetical protein